MPAALRILPNCKQAMEFHSEQTADNGDNPGPSPPNSLPQSVLADQGGDRDDKSDANPKPAHEVGEADMMNSEEEGNRNKGQSLNVMEEGGAGAPPVAAAPNNIRVNENEAARGDGLGDASTKARPLHEQTKTNTNGTFSPTDASTTVLDIEQGGGSGNGDRDRPRSGGNDDDSVGNHEKGGLSNRSAAQIASAAAAFGPASASSSPVPAQGGVETAAKGAGDNANAKPPRKGLSSRKRSSFVRKDSDERRRSSQIIAAERRAEAQKAAAAAALAGGGLAYANMSNHSTNSLRSAVSSGTSKSRSEQNFQSEESSSKAVGAPPLPTSASADGTANAGSSAGQSDAAMTAKEYLTAQSNSKRGLSMDSQQVTVVTAPVDSLAANGSSGDNGQQQNDKPKIGQESGTTADLSASGNGPLFPVKVDGSAMMRKTCLNTNYSLRHQLYLSFGTVSAIALMFVVLVAIITTSLAGNQVKYTSRQNLESWAIRQLGHSARKAADTLTRKLSNFDGLATILSETAKDRFVGYPDHPSYANDEMVPFLRHSPSGGEDTYAYPLKSNPLPRDWQLKPNVNIINGAEHLQDRVSWYERGTGFEENAVMISTASAVYRQQGACDPSVTDPSNKAYYPGCTEANNDASTGGVAQPTETAGPIAAKAADLNFILKPLYEYHNETRGLGYYFANNGAGSVVSYPHLMQNGLAQYTSAGCDWMAEPNPLDPSRPIGTQEVIERCHPDGERVNAREYNPLERGWCREQALNPQRTTNVGPYLDANVEDLWLMTFGRAVYDRVTGEFIACTLADVGVDQLAEIVEEASIGETTETALVRWDEEGTVVASPKWISSSATSTVSVFDEDLGIGLDKETFEQIKSLVDFTQPWDSLEARKEFEDNLFRVGGKMLSAFPIPEPPFEYDPNYFPEFMVVSSIEVDEVFDAVNRMDAAVSASVSELIRDTLIVGFVGMAIIVIVIFIVGLYLTHPLNQINSIGSAIINTFGDHNQAINVEDRELWCNPRTEISELAREFRTMVMNFSGSGTARIVKQKFTEVLNPFALFGEFKELYESRRDEFFPYVYNGPDDANNAPIMSLLDYERQQARSVSIRLPCRRNYGQNIRSPHDAEANADAMSHMTLKHKDRMISSPLFRWVVASITTPLIVTMIVISALVTYEISQLFPTLVLDVQEAFIGLETQALAATASLRASFAGEVMDHAIRDLHLLTRVSSWLLFGALQSADDFFPALHTGAEQCKIYPNDGSCPLMTNRFHSPCDCQWNDKWDVECYDYDTGVGDTRYYQKSFYEGLRQDSWPNGDRNYTTFPQVATSAKTTEWWGEIETFPGAEKGDLSRGYATTYDRVRMLATLQVLQIPLYNYGALASSGRPLATYIGFESDGMFSGYAGCKHTHHQYSHWKSSEENGGAKLRPEICPLGKHGYDPRCRGWFDAGKKIANEGGNPLHVTAPYPFASGATAQSSTLPLVDPITGTHVGQALVDFLPEDIVVQLRPENTPLADKGFPILITAQPNSFGADTVVGPGYSIGESEGQPIGDLVLPDDENCKDAEDPNCANRLKFEEILVEMRAGRAGTTTFNRTSSTGESEKVYIAFAPVISKEFAPTNSSDFSRGVTAYDSMIYSLAVLEPEAGFLRPFQESVDVERSVNVALGVLLALIIMAAIVVCYVTSRITVRITKPFSQLLELVQNVNRSDIKEDLPDLPELEGGSREAAQVYGIFERLYTVIRFANSAFFSGDLDKAYTVLSESLSLFTQLDNKKAIAIANNNLGITCLTMYRTLENVGGDSICGMNVEEIIERGMLHFNQAIALGEEALLDINEKEGWSKSYLIFMQQLSNRYFNRAMFFLSVRNSHPQPEEAERLGMKDLTVTRELDIEVADNGGDNLFEDDESARFALVLGRIRGLLILMRLSYPDDWDLEELFEVAIDELSIAKDNPKHAIFQDIAPAGMMQQLDSDLIQFVEVDRDGIIMAARIGIRMLVEDEYVLPDAALKAAETLLHYLNVVEDAGIPIQNPKETRDALRRYIAIFSSSLECPEDEDMQRHLIMKQSNRGDVTMETF